MFKMLDQWINTFIQTVIKWKYLRAKVLIGLVFICACAVCWYLFPSCCTHTESASSKSLSNGHSESFSAHFLAVALELFLVFVLVELIWNRHEHSREKEEQVRSVTIYMFHTRMRKLFITNFMALRSNKIVSDLFEKKKLSTIPHLDDICYQTQTAKAAVVYEYVKAEDVWQKFLDLGIKLSIERMVNDMTLILQLVEEVKELLHSDSITNVSPEMFATRLTQDQNSDLIDRFEPSMKDGIVKFFEYAKELRDSNEELFNNLIEFYSCAYRERTRQAERRRIEQMTVVVHSSLKVDTAALKQSNDMK